MPNPDEPQSIDDRDEDVGHDQVDLTMAHNDAVRALTMAQVVDPAPSPRQVTEAVDDAAKAEMARLGYDPEAWDRMPNTRRDDMRLRALDTLRKAAGQ